MRRVIGVSCLKGKQLFYLFLQKLLVQRLSECALSRQVFIDEREPDPLGQNGSTQVHQHIGQVVEGKYSALGTTAQSYQRGLFPRMPPG